MLFQNGGIPNLIKKTTLTENYRVIENEVVAEEGNGQSTLNDNLQGDISRIDVKVLFDLYKLIGTLGSSNTVSALNGLVDNKIELGTNLIKAIRVLEELKQDLGREKR